MREPLFPLALTFFALTLALQLSVSLAAGNVTISPNPGKDLVMLTGESQTLTCTADNSTDVAFWLGPNYESIGRNASSHIYVTDETVNSSTLVLANPTKADSGLYGCLSIDTTAPFKVVSSIHFHLHVFHPTRLSGLANYTMREDRTLTMQCTVTSDADIDPEITWFYQGRDLSAGPPAKYRILTSTPYTVWPRNCLLKRINRLTIPRVKKEDEGEYSCRVNSTNAYLANEEELRVNLKVLIKPRFLDNTPNTIWIDEETVNPILVKLSCSITGDPVATLSWFQGGVHEYSFYPSQILQTSRLPSSMGNATAQITNKANTSNLVLSFPSIDDFKSHHAHSGRQNPKTEFTCGAANDWGEALNVFELKLGHRPVEPVILSLNYTDDGHVRLQLKERDEQTGPPVDAYRLDVGPEKGHIFEAASNGNQTYAIKMNLALGEHKVTLVAHNALGWTQNTSRAHLLTVNEPESVQASFEVDGNSSSSFPRLSCVAILVILLTRKLL